MIRVGRRASLRIGKHKNLMKNESPYILPYINSFK